MPLKQRHRARRLSLQALCCLDVQGDRAMDLAIGFIDESQDDVEACFQARDMLVAAWDFRAQADDLMGKLSRHWDIRRMPVVDRNILRLAIWELSTRTAPTAVIIHEAVRLAKEFSTNESPRFINGILDAVARSLGQEQKPEDLAGMPGIEEED